MKRSTALVGATLALTLGACTTAGFYNAVEVQRASEVQAPGGVRYVDLRVGEGDPAHEGVLVSVHYVASIQDAAKPFDSSHDRGLPLEFVVGAGQVVPGWEEGMIGMRTGGLRRLVIPPEGAYGAEGHGDVIPPDATIVLEVELLELRPADE